MFATIKPSYCEAKSCNSSSSKPKLVNFSAISFTRALILETFGDGNGPSDDSRFLRAIESAVNDGMVVVGCSQCLHGGVTQSKYATGTALAQAGVISARDMTIEAVFAKLLYLLSSNMDPAMIRNRFSENLVGELTPVDENKPG